MYVAIQMVNNSVFGRMEIIPIDRVNNLVVAFEIEGVILHAIDLLDCHSTLMR